jgi:hypothetical protein
LGELVKCKTSKIYPTTKNSYQDRHIRPPSRILETLARHVRPPGQTCPASQPYPAQKPGSSDSGRTCRPPARTCLSDNSSVTKSWTGHIQSSSRIPEVFPGHVRPNSIPQLLSPRPDIFGLQAVFQRGWSDMSDPRPRHVRVSDTPTTRFSWGL